MSILLGLRDSFYPSLLSISGSGDSSRQSCSGCAMSGQIESRGDCSQLNTNTPFNGWSVNQRVQGISDETPMLVMGPHSL